MLRRALGDIPGACLLCAYLVLTLLDASWASFMSVLSGGCARRSQDQRHMSPFSYGAKMSGIDYVGGKPDDITVVVAYVTDAAKL